MYQKALPLGAALFYVWHNLLVRLLLPVRLFCAADTRLTPLPLPTLQPLGSGLQQPRPVQIVFEGGTTELICTADDAGLKRI